MDGAAIGAAKGKLRRIGFAAACALPFWAALSAIADSGSPPQRPALDPPAITGDESGDILSRARASAFDVSAYSHGDPTAEEQYMLELINRARANPPAEGWRLQTTTDPDILGAYSYFQVDLAKLVADFAGYPPRPPLAFNADLIAAARGHSQDMVVNDFQGHTGSDGSTMSTRIEAAGYTGWNALAENVYAYAESVVYGHAGFNADWGVPGLGHRQNIMNFSAGGPVYTEIGIGIVADTSSSTAIGPLVVTEDFGRRSGQLFVVGVVYRDQDHDGFYSVGEGIAGITVATSQGNYAYTSASGGYAIPLAGSSGSIIVRAEGIALGAAQEYSVSLAGTSVKVDFVAAARSDQSIVFGAPPTVAVGGTGTVSATATSGLAVTFSSLTTGVCAVVGSSVIGVSAGICTIAADQAGDANYNPAAQTVQSFSVLQPGSMLLSVARLGTGGGTVASSPPGILCGADCNERYAPSTLVTLTAAPFAGSAFSVWGGACTGTGACTAFLSADTIVMAAFVYIGSAYSHDYVQKAYVAYYGRPADPTGQAYWAGRMDADGQSLDSIIDAFSHSDEFNRRYGALSDADLVTRIYQQALGRNPDQGGLDWYVAELEARRLTLQTITLNILNGASTAPDSTVVANKLDVAAYYTAKAAAGCAYGTEQDGANALSGVTAAAATVATAKAAIDSRCGP